MRLTLGAQHGLIIEQRMRIFSSGMVRTPLFPEESMTYCCNGQIKSKGKGKKFSPKFYLCSFIFYSMELYYI